MPYYSTMRAYGYPATPLSVTEINGVLLSYSNRYDPDDFDVGDYVFVKMRFDTASPSFVEGNNLILSFTPNKRGGTTEEKVFRSGNAVQMGQLKRYIVRSSLTSSASVFNDDVCLRRFVYQEEIEIDGEIERHDKPGWEMYVDEEVYDVEPSMSYFIDPAVSDEAWMQINIMPHETKPFCVGDTILISPTKSGSDVLAEMPEDRVFNNMIYLTPTGVSGSGAISWRSGIAPMLRPGEIDVGKIYELVLGQVWESSGTSPTSFLYKRWFIEGVTGGTTSVSTPVTTPTTTTATTAGVVTGPVLLSELTAETFVWLNSKWSTNKMGGISSNKRVPAYAMTSSELTPIRFPNIIDITGVNNLYVDILYRFIDISPGYFSDWYLLATTSSANGNDWDNEVEIPLGRDNFSASDINIARLYRGTIPASTLTSEALSLGTYVNFALARKLTGAKTTEIFFAKIYKD